MGTVTYRLERRIDNEWYVWGNFDKIEALVCAAAELGSYGYTETKIRVTAIGKD